MTPARRMTSGIAVISPPPGHSLATPFVGSIAESSRVSYFQSHCDNSMTVLAKPSNDLSSPRWASGHQHSHVHRPPSRIPCSHAALRALSMLVLGSKPSSRLAFSPLPYMLATSDVRTVFRSTLRRIGRSELANSIVASSSIVRALPEHRLNTSPQKVPMTIATYASTTSFTAMKSLRLWRFPTFTTGAGESRNAELRAGY